MCVGWWVITRDKDNTPAFLSCAGSLSPHFSGGQFNRGGRAHAEMKLNRYRVHEHHITSSTKIW